MTFFGKADDCPHGVVALARCVCCDAQCDPESHQITGYPATYSRDLGCKCVTCGRAIGSRMRIRLDLTDKKWLHDVCLMDLVHAGVRPSKAAQPLRQCAAQTRNGNPCNNGAMEGSAYCGPHADQARRLNLADVIPINRAPRDQGKRAAGGAK